MPLHTHPFPLISFLPSPHYPILNNSSTLPSHLLVLIPSFPLSFIISTNHTFPHSQDLPSPHLSSFLHICHHPYLSWLSLRQLHSISHIPYSPPVSTSPHPYCSSHPMLTCFPSISTFPFPYFCHLPLHCLPFTTHLSPR